MQLFLDMLKAAPKSPKAKLNVFLLSFDPKAKNIGIFLEGRDDPSFFRVHIKKIAEEANLDVTITVLGGKKDVLYAWRYLEERFPDNPRLMFFVDKDHDDLIGATEGTTTQGSLFVTTHYSIENFLVSEEAIAVILTDTWGLDSSSGAIEAACQNFTKFQQAYRIAFLPWMAWLLAARRSGTNAQSNNIKFPIFSVNANYEPILKWKPDMLTHLVRVCCEVNDTLPDAAAMALATSELETLPTKVWLRGKQELWCLLAFLNRLEHEVRNDEELKRLKKCPKIRSQINPDNAVEWLAPRLRCPKELNDYLTTRLGAL
jgi:hypothetical protein